MRKLIIFLAVFVVTSVGGLSLVQAQTDETEVANIPFDFYAGGQKMPAGTYTVGIDVERQTILLSDRSGGHKMFLLGTSDAEGDNQSVLVFKHLGNTYALEQVKSDFIDLGFSTKVPQQAMESHLALPQVEVALNRM